MGLLHFVKKGDSAAMEPLNAAQETLSFACTSLLWAAHAMRHPDPTQLKQN